jgi:hypothetical protein
MLFLRALPDVNGNFQPPKLKIRMKKRPSPLIQCPHCYFRVLPSKEGYCPSCHKDVHDLNGVDPSKILMDIPDTMPLPDFCLNCARPTKRRVKILSKADLEKEPTLFNFLKQINQVSMVPLYAYADYGDMDGTSPTVAMNVPQCDECASREKPKPIHTDFENMRMTFIVHKNFKKKALSVRESANKKR